MGKGDRRSKKGKIWSSSYGNVRPKQAKIVKAQIAAAKAKKSEEATAE